MQNESNKTPYGWTLSSVNIGTPPFERVNHTGIVTDDNNLIILGGHDKNGNTLNDLVIYNLTQKSWKYPIVNSIYTHKGTKLISTDSQFHLTPNEELSPIPAARAYHTATYFQDKMYVFGGNSFDLEGQIYILDTQKINWTVVSSPNGPEEVKTSRFRHTADLWGKKIIIFGGTDGSSPSSTPLNSLISFDLLRYKWKVIPNHLPPIHSHSSFIRNKTLYIVGGYTEDGCNTFSTFSLIDGTTTTGIDILPRTITDHFRRHFLTTTYDENLDRIYIFGGFEFNEDNYEIGCSEKLFIFDFKTQQLSIFPSRVSPPPKCSHSTNFHDGKLIVFGGSNRLPVLTGDWVFCYLTNTVWIFTPPGPEYELSSCID